MSQIFLFTGENEYLLRQTYGMWMQEFIKKHGRENLSRIDAKKTSFKELVDEVSAMPFIASSRLVICYGIPKATKEEMQMLQSNIHPQVILVFVEPKPDKRLGSSKELMKIAEVKQCNPVLGAQLRTWIQEELGHLGASIEPKAVDELLDILGEDQNLIAQELAKLALYADGRSITAEDVEILVLCCGERQVWKLMDLIGQGRKDLALEYVQHLLRQGESVHGLWNIFLWMASQILPTASAVEDGIHNPGAIAKEMGVSFGSARSLLPVVQRCDRSQLKEIVDRITEFDRSLKTGGYKATAEQPQELEVIIDRSIIACCECCS